MPKRKRTPPFISRGAVIRTQRIAMRMTVKALESKTRLSYRTINKAERGWSISDESLAEIAVALGLDLVLLKHDPDTLRQNTTSSKFPMGSFVDVLSKRGFDDLHRRPEYKEFEIALLKAMQAAQKVVRLMMFPGSCRITYSMTFGDIHRLCVAFVRGRLANAPLLIETVRLSRASTPEDLASVQDFLAQLEERRRTATQ